MTTLELADKIKRYREAEFQLWNFATCNLMAFSLDCFEGHRARQASIKASYVHGMVRAMIDRALPTPMSEPGCMHPELGCKGSCKAEYSCND